MMRRNQHSKSRLSLWACSTVMALCLNSTPAAAAFVQGVQLTPVERIRGPYQHTVVGASLLSDNGTPESGSATLDLPNDAYGHRARLSWMGTGLTPDRVVSFTLPNGSVFQVHAVDPAAEVDTVR